MMADDGLGLPKLSRAVQVSRRTLSLAFFSLLQTWAQLVHPRGCCSDENFLSAVCKPK